MKGKRTSDAGIAGAQRDGGRHGTVLTIQCVCITISLLLLALLALPAGVTGQREDGRPDIRMRPPVRDRTPSVTPEAREGLERGNPGGPVAVIVPSQLTVRQGQSAVFGNASRYDPDTPLVRQRWTGPMNQRGQGGSFEITTWNLEPGVYQITLEVTDRRERISRTHASLVVVSSPARPVARVRPERVSVAQGERAFFESLSIPEGLLGERWMGPRGQRAEGRHFEVVTGDLSPGEYEIVLDVVDRDRRRNRAVAVLEVRAPVEGPGGREIPVRVRLNVQPNPAKKGEGVSFGVIAEPPREDLEYRFVFGDGQVREWSRDTRAVHYYENPGRYDAQVFVRSGEETSRERDAVAVVIGLPVAPPPDEDRRWMIPAVAFGVGGGYLLLRSIRKRFLRSQPKIGFEAVKDPGEQGFETEGGSGIEREVRIRTVADRGEQTTVIEGSFVTDERRNHE